MNVLFFPCYLDGMPRTSASVRFRALWPAKHWPEADVYPDMRLPLGEYDAYIFQKAYLSKETRRLILDLRCRGKLLALDLCDADWLLSDQHERRLLSVLPTFDLAVAPTPALRDWLARWVPSYVIPDRLDLDLYPAPKAIVHQNPPRLIWFGYSHNLVYLDAAWDEFLTVLDQYDLPLTILSDKLPAEWRGRKWSKDREPRFVEWTLEGADAEISAHDIALVPPTTEYKSDNRTITAWALGVATAESFYELWQLVDDDRLHAQQVTYRLHDIHVNYDVRLSVLEWQNLLRVHAERRAQASAAIRSVIDVLEGARQ